MVCNKSSAVFSFLLLFSWVAAILVDRVFNRIWVVEGNVRETLHYGNIKFGLQT